jgi:hypothetical protein
MSDETAVKRAHRSPVAAARYAKLYQFYSALTSARQVSAWTDDPADTWLLVERSFYNGSFWLSTHPSAQEAADRHDRQESPEDWPVVVLVDLNTGDRYRVRPATAWELCGKDEKHEGEEAPR